MPRCIECNVKFKPKYFLQKFCLQNETCIDASVKYVMEFNSTKAIEKRHKEIKVEVEGTNQLEKAARLLFQKWIRERDKDLPCISCNKTDAELGPNMFDSGHFFSAERFSGLIFDETNVHKQCKKCNGVNMHGNLVEYRKGLINRYGEDYVFELESISDANRVYKYSRSELIDIANKYKMKLKELQKANQKP